MRVARLCGVLAVLALVAGCSTDSGGDGNLSVVSFSASPSEIVFGSSVLVSWETTASQRVRLQACSGFNVAAPEFWCEGGSVRELAVDNPTARNGAVVVTLQASTQFRLTVFGEGDQAVYSDPATVMLTTVPPTGPQVVDFRATPRRIFSGDAARLIVRVLDSPQLEICDATANPTNPARWSVLATVDPDGDGIVVADREERPTTTRLYALRETGADAALAYTALTVHTSVAAVPRILAFAAEPATVDEGGSVVLSWDTLDATVLEVDPEVTGFDPTSASGTVTFTPTFSGTERTSAQLYTLTATNGVYSDSAQALVTVRGAPQVTSFVAAPPSVLPGGAVVLTWATARTDTVTIVAVPPDATLLGPFATSGSTTVNPAASTTYTLTATGSTTATATATANVTVGTAPTVDSFTATPGVVAVGGSAVTLTWATTNATTVSIVGVPPDATLPGPFAVDGTATAHPAAGSTTYTLTATGAMGGPATATASVTVVAVGDLVVTEIMFDPAGVVDNLGEWFEVRNIAAYAIPLAGLVLSDGTGTHTVSGTGSIAAGDWFVFGINSNTASNGGATVDYQYTTLTLPNTGALGTRVSVDGVLIDGVAYTVPGGWTEGNSMTLNPAFLTAVGNDTAANWCPARAADTYGTSGNHGTPGATNACI